MKNRLVTGIKKLMSAQIECQGKEVMIDEVVRIVFDESYLLGVTIFPHLDHDGNWTRKNDIKNKLKNKYAEYSSSHASVGDIVTDLLAEFELSNISVVVLTKIAA